MKSKTRTDEIESEKDILEDQRARAILAILDKTKDGYIKWVKSKVGYTGQQNLGTENDITLHCFIPIGEDRACILCSLWGKTLRTDNADAIYSYLENEEHKNKQQ